MTDQWWQAAAAMLYTAFAVKYGSMSAIYILGAQSMKGIQLDNSRLPAAPFPLLDHMYRTIAGKGDEYGG